MPNPTCPRCGTAIEEHEATRCLDAWVAEEVMGWKWLPTPDPEGKHHCWVKDGCEMGDFEPSRDIAAAWEVVEHIVKSLKAVVDVQVRYGSECVVWVYTEKGEYVSIHNSAPLAICRAAIMAATQEEKA